MPRSKPLAWLHGEVKTPPFSANARVEAGFLRQLQNGVKLALPQSRPMPNIEQACHELRVRDANRTWRIVYALEPDALVILEVFAKKTEKTPDSVIKACRRRLKQYRST